MAPHSITAFLEMGSYKMNRHFFKPIGAKERQPAFLQPSPDNYLPPVPPFLLMQKLSSKGVARSAVTS